MAQPTINITSGSGSDSVQQMWNSCRQFFYLVPRMCVMNYSWNTLLETRATHTSYSDDVTLQASLISSNPNDDLYWQFKGLNCQRPKLLRWMTSDMCRKQTLNFNRVELTHTCCSGNLNLLLAVTQTQNCAHPNSETYICSR